MLSALRRVALGRTPLASTSRPLATLAPPLPEFPRADQLDPKNRFIVPSKPPRAPVKRYGAKSSRVRASGRSPSQAPNYLREESDRTKLVGEVKIYLPSVFMRLVRNTAEHAGDPYTATFRTDLRLTKPDIANYLKNIYGLAVTSLRTINYLSAVKRNPVGGGYSRTGGTKNYKKVMVTMQEPFWYPEERSREWCNEHFERDRMEELRDRKMLRIGDGNKYGVSSPRYRGAGKSKVEIERLTNLVLTGGTDIAARSDGKASERRPSGLKMRKNVMARRAEKAGELRSSVQDKMEQLREQGY